MKIGDFILIKNPMKNDLFLHESFTMVYIKPNYVLVKRGESEKTRARDYPQNDKTHDIEGLW